MSTYKKAISSEELASHSIRANHELINDLGRAKQAQERITNEMPDIFGLMTREGRVIKANVAYATLVGKDEEDIYGTILKDLFLDESWKIVEKNLDLVLSSKTGPATFELPIDRKSSETLYHWSFAPFAAVSDRRGQLFSFIGKDITILRDFERKLSNIFSAIPLGVLTINSKKQVEWPYSAYSEVLLARSKLENLPAEDVIFGRALKFLNASQATGVKTFLDQIGAEEQWYDMSKDQFPKELPMGDSATAGPNAWRGMTYNPIIRSGVVEKVLVVIEDITERVRLRHELATKASREQKLAQIIMDLQEIDPMFLNSCVEDVTNYLFGIDQLLAQAGSARSVCNALHGIKGVARTVNLRSFKDLIHDVETRILAGAPKADSDLNTEMKNDLAVIRDEWTELKRYISVFKAPDEGTPQSAPGVGDNSPVLLKKREAIEALALNIQKNAPKSLLPELESLLRQVRSIGRVPFSSLEPKISSFFEQTRRKLGKNARLICDWSTAELDRASGPAASEIFYHLLTNALDHGVESPESRAEKKKDEEAKVRITATVKQERITFVVEDDGKGMDTKAMAAKALEKGLIKTTSGLTDEKIWNLALLSGVSTATKVTDTSGRGIGLDAVDERVKKLGGEGLRIVWSKLGSGTRFEFSIKQ